MHRRAHEVLPALLQALNADTRRATRNKSARPYCCPAYSARRVSIHSIQLARSTYLERDLNNGLAQYHNDPDLAFQGWNDIGLGDAFREWSIEDEIETICRALLAVQGVADEYGTLRQVCWIAQRLQQAVVVEMIECRHSPHRDQPERLIV